MNVIAAVFCLTVALAPTEGHTPVTICHKGKLTITVDDDAVKAHLKHGDTIGPCKKGEESSTTTTTAPPTTTTTVPPTTTTTTTTIPPTTTTTALESPSTTTSTLPTPTTTTTAPSESTSPTMATSPGSPTTTTASPEQPFSPTSELPRTGTEVNVLLLVSLGLVGAGLLALKSSRRAV